MATEVRPPLGAPNQYTQQKGEDTGAAIKRWQQQEEEFIADLQRKCRSNGWPGDTIGEMLRWPRGDGYAVYMVWRERPLQIFRVEVGDAWQIEPSTIRGLTLRDVKEMIGQEKALREMFSKPQEFYDTLEPGDIVHYTNGFAQFVRAKVVEFDPKTMKARTASELKPGEKALQEIALVGEIGKRQLADGTWVHGWNEWDLPRYMADGSIYYGYHAENVISGAIFKPSASTLWEYPQFYQRAMCEKAGIDPTKMKPISLDPPPMSAEQKRIVPLAKAINQIRSMTDGVDMTDEVTLRSVLVEVHNIAGSV